jgi:hypothetical protein
MMCEPSNDRENVSSVVVSGVGGSLNFEPQREKKAPKEKNASDDCRDPKLVAVAILLVLSEDRRRKIFLIYVTHKGRQP